jgi:hypothetical protein
LLENNINIIGQQVNSMEPMANNQADSITNNTLDKTTDTINLKEKADDKAIENN